MITPERANAYMRLYNDRAQIETDPIRATVYTLFALSCLAMRHAAAVSEPAAYMLIRAAPERSPYKQVTDTKES